MKKIAHIIFLFCGLNLSFFSNAQSKSAELLGKEFIAALQTQKASQLFDLMPSNAIYRQISPSETQGKSEADLSAMRKIAQERLNQHFSRILASAHKESITLNDLRFHQAKTEAIPSKDANLHFLVLYYSYLNKTSKISLMVCQEAGDWYLLEISQSADIFASLFE